MGSLINIRTLTERVWKMNDVDDPRRDARRVKLEVDAWVINGSDTNQITVLDLSSSGIGFMDPASQVPDGKFQARLALGGKRTELPMLTVWRAGNRVGARFVDMDERMQSRIDGSIARIFENLNTDAEAAYKAEPTSTDALSCVIMTRFFMAEQESERRDVLAMFHEMEETYPEDLALITAGARLYLAAGETEITEKYVAMARGIDADDSRVGYLDQLRLRGEGVPENSRFRTVVSSKSPAMPILIATVIVGILLVLFLSRGA